MDTDNKKDGDKDDIRMLFPTVIQVSQIADHEALNRGLLEVIDEVKRREPSSKPDSWSCDLFTTIGAASTFLTYQGVEAFQRIAIEKVMKYADVLKMDTANHPLRMNECWVNIYGRNHSQEIHLHQNSVFSGIYYVKAPAGAAATLFHSPMSDMMLEPPTIESNHLNSSIAGFSPVAGRMIVFRSSLRHNVLSSNIDEERITIAFNVTM